MQMPSNPDSQVQFRDITLCHWLDEHEGRDRRNAIAKQALLRYQLILSDGLRYVDMSLQEAIDLWIELNGANLSHPDELPRIWNETIDSLRAQNKSVWVTIQMWKLPTWIAVVDAVQRIGAGAYSIETLEDEFKRVGLIKPCL